MLSNEKVKQFADLAIKIGVNLQPNQELNINSPIECAPIVRIMAQAAYDAGAKSVSVKWSDEKLSRINIDNQSIETLQEIPDWIVQRANYIVDKGCANISISAGDPSIYAGVDPVKLQKSSQATRKAIKYYYDKMMANACRWLVVSIPTKAWADKVFPNCEDSVDKLWDAIARTMRLDQDDPVKAWEEHIIRLNRRAKFMNDKDFEYVHMTSKNGTDLMVGLSEGHIWCAAQEEAQDGIMFTANLPTEEIFTAPHKYKVNGVVHNALPLVDNGNIIDEFYVKFKDGKVVDYDAKQGKDALKNIIETDEGSCYLGEVALIGKNSPISQLGILFYNTLFDENASCHLALGKGYPSTVKGGVAMTKEQLDKVGVNESAEHCDFMVGTTDMNIEGITKSGERVQLFVDGEWVI
ncbi:MAG: aminopeptidase [Clostridia bacterium]|nr:aminopeptidase [Clostridia bacterium]